MPERWTAALLRHRLAVVGAWLAVLGVGIWSAGNLQHLLTGSFAVPGTDSDRAAAILAANFGERPEGTFTVAFRVRHSSDPALRARLQYRLARAARTVPGGYATTLLRGAGVLYADVRTGLDLRQAKGYTDDLRRALRSTGGPPAFVSGQPAVQHDLDPILASDIRRGEAVAVPLALLILVAVLGISLAAVIPFAVAACTITGTLAAAYGLAHATTLVAFVPNLVELIGLGLAVDYSLLVVHRFREELAHGARTDAAVATTMKTAGRSVVFSGATVAIGFGLLALMPVPFIRSMGIGGFLIPVASVAAALTLLPALLSLLGPNAVRTAGFGGLGPAVAGEGFWAGLARTIMRRPVLYLAAGSALLVAAAVPVFYLHLTPGSISSLPQSPESVRGYLLLRDRVGPGAVTPTRVAVDAGRPGLALVPTGHRAIDRLVDRIFHDPETLIVASGRKAPYVDPSGRYAQVIVAGRHEYGDDASRAFVDRLRDRLVPAAHLPAGMHAYAGGAPPQGADFLSRSYAVFPWLVLGVLALTFVALLVAFRSVLLPLKAVLLNLLTVAAVYGLLVVVFRWGVGADLLGVGRADHVEGWIPIFLFAVLFGLSMDYEVFMVTRMREAWLETGDNSQAVARGLERTGRIVTAAALIMVAAFAGFVTGRVLGLQELGVGLVLAILIDATLVRAVLVPSIMAVLGRWNWWLPGTPGR